MLTELYPLSDVNECDYSSFVFTLNVFELIKRSHSSNIQRLRNEKKEDGIMKFLKDVIDKKQTPFLQPFILHYNGNVDFKDGKYSLDAEPKFEIIIPSDSAEKDDEKRYFEFEVIDGNGRLNAMIRLQNYYKSEILKSTNQLEKTDDINKKRRLENKIYDLKTKNNTLSNTKLVVQLYINLNDDMKAKLFNSVNQGEKMSQGRLKVYDSDKKENIILSNYIKHTESEESFPYEITPDKDTLRSAFDRENYVPAVYILPVIRKLMKFAKSRNIEDSEAFIFEILDFYITESSNPPHLRKHFFSILGSVIDTASKSPNADLNSCIINMIDFDYTRYEDVSKQLKKIRTDIIHFVFNQNN